MDKRDSPQFNIRSSFARERAALLAKKTGMTTTQVVEEALRAYLPLPQGEVPAKLARKGVLLVKPATGRTVTLEAANAALDEIRASRN